MKPIFKSWQAGLPVQGEVWGGWCPKPMKRKTHPISQMSPGKFCPGCGHQITNNQILGNQIVTDMIFESVITLLDALLHTA